MTVTTCKTENCGAEIHFARLTLRREGRGDLEVGTPAYCDDCIERIETEERGQAAADRFRSRVERSGLPVPLQRIALPDSGVGELARKWAHGEIQGLCLTGPIGVGKTHLAAAAVWERLQTRGCRWVSVARLMTQLRGGFDDEARKAASRVIAAPSAVVLDDLDKVNATDYGREVIFAAIDGRVEAGAPLLVTTNLGPEQIGAKLGDAVKSRLAGYCEVIRMTGPDRRVT